MPQNDGERLVNSITMVIGALIYAVIFGNISLYIANLNRDETNYQETTSTLIAHMKDISLPTKLQRKVLSYHDYVWQKNRGDNNNKLDSIPQRVQVEVSKAIHGRMIKSNAAFANAPESFINAAALSLRFTVCLPNEYVFQQGEIAESIFFIGRGQVGVFRDEYGSLTVLGASSFFGEIPLLLEKQKDNVGKDNFTPRHSLQSNLSRLSNLLSTFRIQSVRGYAYCDLWKMDYESFDELMKSHPQLKSLMVNIAAERVKQKKFYDDELMVHKVGMKFIRESQKKKRIRIKRSRDSKLNPQAVHQDFDLDNQSPRLFDVDNVDDEKHNDNENILSTLEKHIVNISNKVNSIESRATNITKEIVKMKGKSNEEEEDEDGNTDDRIDRILSNIDD